MLDTCRVFKESVRCAACGSRQYETMLRIAEGAPVTCVECHQDIDLAHDNSVARVLTFVQSELAGRDGMALPLSGRLATLDGYYRTALVSPANGNIAIETAAPFSLAPA
jgi:hypothetical protein